MADPDLIRAKLNALIEPEAKALGFDLVRVKLFGGAGDLTLQVMAERPDTRQLTIDDCAELSRRISDRLDALEEQGTDLIDEEYRLEVSSPGIDRPLTRLADFADWAGHDARINLAQPVDGRKQLTGVLKGVEGDRITIDVRKHGDITIGFADVGDAKLLLTDRLIAATRPLSMDGADEEEFEHDDSDALESAEDEGLK
ncbi:ribosome maturation protein RimP [Sphingomonas sp. H39-1-10]|uniref:ribosome maturation protein RimP n=1 Tax=Sphingomonas TaxID=13687 RepID=UPI0008805CBA|nr:MULTISPECIES: ribosome maturation protein RimP [Sphingomonas]MDF0487021.1 ribosome maturation protein RimP [Sphingomonas pollutisoli]SDA26918.1 ribosome maturation factor RimP [Sphingomonas sp. NFR15]